MQMSNRRLCDARVLFPHTADCYSKINPLRGDLNLGHPVGVYLAINPNFLGMRDGNGRIQHWYSPVHISAVEQHVIDK